MATYTTQPAYIFKCVGWDPQRREHPVFDWMCDHEESFDFGPAKTEPYTNWYTDDFCFTDASGSETVGPAAWQAWVGMYSAFSAHFHEPFFVVIFETPSGYELLGCAKIFANLAKPGEKGDERFDGKGRGWEIEVPGSFHFTYVREEGAHKGLKISAQRLFTDSLPVIGAMMKRGMLSPEDLAKQAGS